ncbi:MAG TPA: segregation/condensation protein A [Candidatus Saccharimonadia bacterium]|nr:segregation/condensation protein A [Candidatus Saccharimonadia bacterium]
MLELVEHSRLEVSAISVGRITGEYLKYVRGLSERVSAEDLSEFLQLGSRLLYIKSLALLPQADPAEADSELRQLEAELAEYRRFQEAAKWLAKPHGRSWERPVSPKLDIAELPLPRLDLERLTEAFTRALKDAPAAPAKVIRSPHLSLETAVGRLKTLLPDGFALNEVLAKCRDRLEIVVTFLAVLELMRSGAAQVSQNGQFGHITLGAVRV